MNYSKSPRSNSRKLTKIDLPEELKTFFGKRRKFIRGLPSYEQIEGSNPENHDHCFNNAYGYPIPLRETHLVNNQEEGEYHQAQAKTLELLHLFFGIPQHKITEPLREYMLTGGTKPIRVSTEIEKREKRVYVKLPSVERIMGLSLYNLVNENNNVDFLFSEYVFVEDSVSGRHIDQESKRYFQRLANLASSVVKLAVQDEFIGLNDLDRSIDLIGRENTLVNLLVKPDGEITAFDVDCAFTTKFHEYDLVKVARENGIDIPDNLEKTVKKQEARRINQVISMTSKRKYNEFIRLMDQIELLRAQFKEVGFNSARDYFDNKKRWLVSLI